MFHSLCMSSNTNPHRKLPVYQGITFRGDMCPGGVR